MTPDYVTPDARIALADQLYDQYYEDLFGYLYRLAGDRDRAADLAQQTLVSIVRAGRGSRKPDPGPVALFRVATNLALGLPAEGRRFAWLPGAQAGQAQAEPEPGPQDTHAAFGQPNAMEQALGALPAADRALVLLRGRYKLDLAAIAQIMGLSPAAAAERLGEAQAQFYEAYESHGQTNIS